MSRPTNQEADMLNYVLIAAQIVVFIILGVLLLQIWRFLHSKDIPDDEPLGKERAKYLSRRATWICICVGLEAVLQIAADILRFVEVI